MTRWMKCVLIGAILITQSSCGTEIGNFLFGGNDPANNAGIPGLGGLSLLNTEFDYRITYPIDWLVDSADLADVTLRNDNAAQTPVDLSSSIRITAEHLSEPITDLLGYLVNSQPGKNWENFAIVTGLVGVRNTLTTVNAGGGIISEIYFTNGPVLLKWDTVANEAAGGDTDVSRIINSLVFID